jgi:hypothetical protein
MVEEKQLLKYGLVSLLQIISAIGSGKFRNKLNFFLNVE